MIRSTAVQRKLWPLFASRLLVLVSQSADLAGARRPAATQKIITSLLRFLSLFAAIVVFDPLQRFWRSYSIFEVLRRILSPDVLCHHVA